MLRSRSDPWVGTALDDLSSFQGRAKSVIGYALRLAQRNEMHQDAKPMHGRFSGLMEIAAPDDNRTFRAVYLVKLADVVYVLHEEIEASDRDAAAGARRDRTPVESRKTP